MRVRSFLSAARVNFLPASVIPFLLGAAYAFNQGFLVSKTRLLLGIIAVVSAHLAGNLFNDYFDNKSGADDAVSGKSPFSGGSRAIQEGAMSPGQVRRTALVFLLLALASTALIAAAARRPAIFLLMLAALVLTVEYTAPPLKLAYRGLGEADIFLLFGTGLVMGGFYIFSGTFTAPSFLLSLPPAFLITAVILGNEIPDFESDARAQKNTLIVLAGLDRGRLLYGLALLASFLSLAANVFAGVLSREAAVVLFVYLAGIKPVLTLKRAPGNRAGLIAAGRAAILLHTLVGTCMILILILKK